MLLILQIGEVSVLRDFAQETILIGRSSSCDVVLDDRRVSRQHARIESVGSQAQLVDLGSGNGTFLNGRKVKSENLLTGDVIQIGRTKLTVMQLRWTSPLEAKASMSTEAEGPAPLALPADSLVGIRTLNA